MEDWGSAYAAVAASALPDPLTAVTELLALDDERHALLLGRGRGSLDPTAVGSAHRAFDCVASLTCAAVAIPEVLALRGSGLDPTWVLTCVRAGLSAQEAAAGAGCGEVSLDDLRALAALRAPQSSTPVEHRT